jgi:hypothetical protein
MNKISRLSVLVAALSIAVACSSSSDEGGGGPAGAAGQQMSELGDLGAQFIEANQATYDTLDQATGVIGAAFAAGLPAPSAATKQDGCLPDELAGQTFLVDVQSGTFTPTVARGEPDEVQFVLLSDPQTEEGYVNITCVGVAPSLSSVNISVNTTGGVEVLNLTASQINVFPPSTFSASLAGTLRSSSGEDEVPIGVFTFEGTSALFMDEFSKSASTAFQVAPTVNALVEQNLSLDPSFASENIRMLVAGPASFDFDEFVCTNDLRFEGFMEGTPGDVSGGSIFCARPPLADGFNYFINCFDGSIDNMVVSQATEACNTGFFGDPPTQVSGGVLTDIQDGTNALLGMHNTVISVAEAGAQVALQLATAAQQQF